MSNHEWIAQVTHQKWANERITVFLSESLIGSFFCKKTSNSLRKLMSEFPTLDFSAACLSWNLCLNQLTLACSQGTVCAHSRLVSNGTKIFVQWLAWVEILCITPRTLVCGQGGTNTVPTAGLFYSTYSGLSGGKPCLLSRIIYFTARQLMTSDISSCLR